MGGELLYKSFCFPQTDVCLVWLLDFEMGELCQRSVLSHLMSCVPDCLNVTSVKGELSQRFVFKQLMLCMAA